MTNNIPKLLAAFFILVCVLNFLPGAAAAGPGRNADTIVVKVAVVYENPVLPAKGGKRMHQSFSTPSVPDRKWFDPRELSAEYEKALEEVSGHVIDYKVVKEIEADTFFTYLKNDPDRRHLTVEEISDLLDEPGWKTFFDVGTSYDYNAMVSHYGFDRMRDNGEIHEVWVWTFPYGGMWESHMMGDGAFWINSRPNENPTCTQLLSIMGLNYERDLACALESYGHRFESTMMEVYGWWDYDNKSTVDELTNWEKYTGYMGNYNRFDPVAGNIGNIHFPPNGRHDYDWKNPAEAKTYADTWFDYPNLDFRNPRTVTCSEWDCSHIGYMKWWFSHIPHFSGVNPADGKLNNWWHYVVDYNAAIRKEQELTSIKTGERLDVQSLTTHTADIAGNRPLVSFLVDGRKYDASSAGSGIDVAFETLPFTDGIHGRIKFTNTSCDTVKLSNVVPFGEDAGNVYITGKGDNYLSRTHLFRPGYEPVNVIVPDNAWELGFTALEGPEGINVAALVRRDRNSIEGGRRARFETVLDPGGSVEYDLWADTYTGDWQEGLRMMFQDRYLYDVAIGRFDNSIMEREDQQWFRSCYAVNLMMTWDRRFYDIEDGSYHVGEHLQRMKRLMGGYDVYSIWPTWPALGMDQRNQWDMYRDLPGGYAKLREISDLCKRLGSRFFLCYNPWDESTRDEEGHFDGMTTITRALDVDGFVLDTKGGSSTELQDAADAARQGVVMYSEGMAVPVDMQGIPSGRVHNALYYPPMLNLNKFIKPDFAIFRVAEEAREPIRREFNVSFFNGYGTEMNNFPPGRFEHSDDQMRYWGSLLRIQRENSRNFINKGYTPLVPTIEDGIFVNRWPDRDKIVYTVYNLRPEGFDGPLFEAEPRDGWHFVDLYHHEELLPVEKGGRFYVPVKAEAFNIYDKGTNNESSVSAIALLPADLSVSLSGDVLSVGSLRGDRIRIWAGTPSYEKEADGRGFTDLGAGRSDVKLLDVFPGYEGKFIVQSFAGQTLLDERVVMIKPGTARLVSETAKTPAAAKAPAGMVTIPAGYFRCDHYRIGDSFIPYPEDMTAPGEEVRMEKFYMDRYPVTNAQYKEFIYATGYVPEDTANFLKHWVDGRPAAGEENFPVIYVTLEDAQAYAAWAGKRLPTEMEWQYAAQTEKGNEWPWVQKTPVTRVEDYITNTLSVWKLEGIEPDRCNLGDGELYPVGKYPKGKNPYGLYDLVGSVWQLTDDVYDNTSYRYIMVRGGSYFLPSSSFWYVQGGPRELYFRQYLLRVSPSFERKATVGFRCVADAQ